MDDSVDCEQILALTSAYGRRHGDDGAQELGFVLITTRGGKRRQNAWSRIFNKGFWNTTQSTASPWPPRFLMWPELASKSLADCSPICFPICEPNGQIARRPLGQMSTPSSGLCDSSFFWLFFVFGATNRMNLWRLHLVGLHRLSGFGATWCCPLWTRNTNRFELSRVILSLLIGHSSCKIILFPVKSCMLDLQCDCFPELICLYVRMSWYLVLCFSDHAEQKNICWRFREECNRVQSLNRFSLTRCLHNDFCWWTERSSEANSRGSGNTLRKLWKKMANMAGGTGRAAIEKGGALESRVPRCNRLGRWNLW